MLGRNFARRGLTVVIPDYSKSPMVSYKEMTGQVAASIEWVKNNVAAYGGDPDNINIMGHSAGGHLAALAIMDNNYGLHHKEINHLILNDAAGLDMETYLKENMDEVPDHYTSTWTSDPAVWHIASPINHINENTPNNTMYLGNKSYNSIEKSSIKFYNQLLLTQPQAKLHRLEKTHTGMVLQLFFPWSGLTDEISQMIKLQD